VLRIIKEDDAHEMVGVNGATAENQEQTFDLTQGRFDVIVTAGPSYASKRAENLAVMMDLAKVIPGFAEIGGDLMVSQMDTPIARQIQERLKMGLPPQFQDKKGQPELPPEIQQQMQQYGQTIDQMTEALNKAHDQLDQKTLELENRKEIALIQQKTELIKALAQIEGKAAHTMLEAEIAAAQAMIGQDQPIMEGQGQMQAPEPIEEVPALDEYQEMPEEPMEPEEVMPPEPTAEEIQSAAILEAMNNQSMALGAVAQALEKLSAPKRLITDKMGRPIGVESVNG
jgi:arsenate reductase-like glutaredoxin family protein